MSANNQVANAKDGEKTNYSNVGIVLGVFDFAAIAGVYLHFNSTIGTLREDVNKLAEVIKGLQKDVTEMKKVDTSRGEVIKEVAGKIDKVASVTEKLGESLDDVTEALEESGIEVEETDKRTKKGKKGRKGKVEKKRAKGDSDDDLITESRKSKNKQD